MAFRHFLGAYGLFAMEEVLVDRDNHWLFYYYLHGGSGGKFAGVSKFRYYGGNTLSLLQNRSSCRDETTTNDGFLLVFQHKGSLNLLAAFQYVFCSIW